MNWGLHWHEMMKAFCTGFDLFLDMQPFKVCDLIVRIRLLLHLALSMRQATPAVAGAVRGRIAFCRSIVGHIRRLPFQCGLTYYREA